MIFKSPYLEVRLADRVDRQPLRHMLELYMHDFSEFDQEDIDEHGLFGYSSLDCFWHQSGHFAYVFKINRRYAGFALVDDDVIYKENTFSIAEFFVLRKYRRTGIGRSAAQMVFDKHQGRWEVSQRRENEPSRRFWQSVITSYTKGQYVELNWESGELNGTVQIFDTSLGAACDLLAQDALIAIPPR